LIQHRFSGECTRRFRSLSRTASGATVESFLRASEDGSTNFALNE